MGPLTPKGRPLPASNGIPADASVNGLYFTEDPVAITQGRMADPHKAGEFVLDAATAKAFGYHLGEEIPVGWLTNAQANSGNLALNSTIPADQRARVKLVGIAGAQATNLFEDQDEAQGQSIELFTPALTDKLLACCSNTMLSALTLQDGNRYLSAVETEIKGVLPKGLPFVYVQVEDRVAIANDTLRPEAIALAVFGGIAGVAALLIAGQVVSRRIRLRAADLDIIRALGASPSMSFCDDLIGTLGAVAVGSVLAGLVALCLSPLAPLGPVRPFLRVEVHADWAVIGLGVAGLLLSLGAIAALASWRALPGRARARGQRTSSSRVTTAAARAGLPPPAITGVRFALEPGVGRSAVPVRSAILGAILAVTVVVATVTFGSSLNTLVSHPALYGWNWTYDMDGGGGLGDVPGQAAAKLLDADPLVESWSGVSYSTLQLDGVNVPVMGSTPRAPVAPPLLSGHGLEPAIRWCSAPTRCASCTSGRGHGGGAGTQRRTGQADDRRHRDAASHRCHGVVTPRDGNAAHFSPTSSSRRGEEPLRGHAGSQRDPDPHQGGSKPGGAAFASRPSGASWTSPSTAARCCLSSGRPRSSTTDRWAPRRCSSGAALAARCRQRPRHHAGHVGPAKTARSGDPQDARLHRTSVGDRRVRAGGRRRRHRLRRRDPGGIALGRVLWDLFAGEISAVPYPTVPVGTIVAIGLLAIALAVLVATIPGRIAARTATSQLLRVE